MPLFGHSIDAIYDGDTHGYLREKADDIAGVAKFAGELINFLEDAAETPEFDAYLPYYESRVRENGYESPVITHIVHRAVENDSEDTARQILEDLEQLRSGLRTLAGGMLHSVDAYEEISDVVILEEFESKYNRVLHNIDVPTEKEVLDNRDEEQDRFREFLNDKEQRQTTEGSDDIDDVLRVLTEVVGDISETVEKEFRNEFHKVEEEQGRGGLPVGGQTLARIAVQAARQTTGLDLSSEQITIIQNHVAKL